MKQPSIKDIAEALGISIGTVDRALHERPGINPSTRASVLKKAEQLGYRPNVAARSLKLNRKLRVGVYLPRQIASFFDPLRAGVLAAASAASGANVELVFRSFARLDEGDVELLVADTSQKFDGIIVAPGNPRHIVPVLRKLSRRGLVIVCVASDAPRSESLATVTVDAPTSGGIAAEIFARTLLKPGLIATITGDLNTCDHAEKLRGFKANLSLFAPHLRLLPAIESHELPREAYRQARALLSRMPYPLGVYISTANSAPVLRALKESKMLGKVQVIATDLFPGLVPYIESGDILATLYQRPFRQGKTALEILLCNLVDGVRPKPITRLAPHIILRSNLALFESHESDSANEGGQRGEV